MRSDTAGNPRRTPTRKSRGFFALRIALLGLLAVLALLLAAGAWLFGTESGARAAFSMLESITGGTVQAEGVHGRLASSVRIDRLRQETADRQVEMKNLRLEWEPSELLQRRLHVRQLRIGDLSVVLKEQEEDSESPRLPDNISLPIALQADKVQIDRARIARGQDEIANLDGAAFSLSFDGGRYRLGLDRLALRTAGQPEAVAAGFSGQATISTGKPYPVDGRFATDAKITLQDRALGTSGQIVLGGTLAELAAGVDLAFQQAQISGQAVLRPFSGKPLGSASIEARAVDLSSFDPDLPATALNLNLAANEDGAGELELTNTLPGLYNNSRVPLTDLRIAFQQEGADVVFSKISAALGTPGRPAGSVSGSGRYTGAALALALQTPELNLQRLDERLPVTRLTGKAGFDRSGDKQEFTIAFNEPLKKNSLALSAHGVLTGQNLTIDRAELKAGRGELALSGRADMSGTQSFTAQGRVSQFRPRDLGNFPQLPQMTLNGKFEVSGTRSPQLAGDLMFRITDSQLAGNPLRGEGRAQLRGSRIIVPNLLLAAGANRLTAQGELSERESTLTFGIQAPKLAQLGSGFAGSVVAKGSARGTATEPRIDVRWNADKVRLPNGIRIDHAQGSAEIDVDRKKPFFIDAARIDADARGLKSAEQQLASLSARLRFSPQPDAPLALDLQAQGIVSGEYRATGFTALADGTTARHTLDARLSGPKQNLTLKASGGLSDLAQAPQWKGAIDRLAATGQINANLQAPAPVTVSQQQLRLDRFRVQADAATIAIEQFVRDPSGISTRGRIERLRLDSLLDFAGPAPVMKTDLQLEGEWDVSIADTINGTMRLQRTGGDVVIQGPTPVALGLRSLRANATATNGRVRLELDARGQKLGRIELDASTSLTGADGRFSMPPDAPVSGRAMIDIPTIAWAGPLMSPALTTEGSLQSNLSIAGTLSDPRLAGQIAGNELRVYSANLGVDLRNGVLRSEFNGSELLVRSLRFRNADGQLTISGPVDFGGGKPNATLTLDADRFMLMNQTDRRLTVSGKSRIALAGGRASVTGDFTVNSGYFDIGRQGTPQLSDDVVIVGRSEEDSGGGFAPALDIRIGLGDGVRIEGRGLDAMLVGQIQLQSAPGEPLQAYGSLRIAKGTYAAYGRELAIERGVLRFTGPIDNPALNIRAMRGGQEVEAGVSVQGTVLAPRVSLVSEPSVPDAEKLSWLVLGRGLSGVGESELGSLQSAAGALLSQGAAASVTSQIANAFGLDTVSLSKSDDTLQQRIITLGKQISSRLYVSYKRGLESANNAVQLRYTLSPRLSVEVEAGARSALSLFYNITFD